MLIVKRPTDRVMIHMTATLLLRGIAGTVHFVELRLLLVIVLERVADMDDECVAL
jgi:hypothetical protein